MTCKIEGCISSIKHKGMCSKHYKRWWRHGDAEKTLVQREKIGECIAEYCTRPKKIKDYCKMHYTRYNRYKRVHNIIADKGEGRPRTKGGYVLLTVNGKRIYEHIYLAQLALGKSLPKGSQVHYMNDIPDDNFRPFNLIICPDQKYHALLHERRQLQKDGLL